MARKQVDYKKSELIAHLRKLADSGERWETMQKTVLPKISCRGEIPPPHAEAPNIERRPAPGTSMDKAAVRHCLRNLCKVRAVMGSVTNAKLDTAWHDRRRAKDELEDYAGRNGSWGRYHHLRRDIEKEKSATARVAKIEAIDAEKRRLTAVHAEASRMFGLLEDKRFFVDEVRKQYPGSFPDIRDWSPPIDRPDDDTRSLIEVEVDLVDWDLIAFDDSECFFIEHISGRWIGDREKGPLYFQRRKAAEAFTDEQMSMSVKVGSMTADSTRGTCEWFASHHRFIRELPTDGAFLYDRYPALLDTRPVDDSELVESLEHASKKEPW